MTKDEFMEMVRVAIDDSCRRSPKILAAPSWIADGDWDAIMEHLGTKGPIPFPEQQEFMDRQTRLATSHFIDLIYECQRLYEIIRLLARDEDIAKMVHKHIRTTHVS